jgi:hypothetical protein
LGTIVTLPRVATCVRSHTGRKSPGSALGRCWEFRGDNERNIDLTLHFTHADSGSAS